MIRRVGGREDGLTFGPLMANEVMRDVCRGSFGRRNLIVGDGFGVEKVVFSLLVHSLLFFECHSAGSAGCGTGVQRHDGGRRGGKSILQMYRSRARLSSRRERRDMRRRG